MENIKDTLQRILEDDVDPETINRVMDLFVLQKEDTLREALAQVDAEIEALKGHPEMYAQQVRILSLRDARNRIVKLLEIKKNE